MNIVNVVKSWEQSILDRHAHHMGITIAKYKLENDSDLFNLFPYLPHNLNQLDPLPVQEAEDEDFVDNFRSTSFDCCYILFDKYLLKKQKRVNTMSMSLQQEEKDIQNFCN